MNSIHIRFFAPTLVAAALAAGLTGCQNNFAANYRPVPGIPGIAAPAPSASAPQVIFTAHLKSEVVLRLGKGYRIIGFSSFETMDSRSESAQSADAARQGKAVGADLVIIKSKDLGEHTVETSKLVPVSTGYDSHGNMLIEMDKEPVEIKADELKYGAVYLRKSTPGT